MAWFPRGTWRYAVLILLLLVLAAVAAMSTLSSIEKFLLTDAPAATPEALHSYLGIITLTILALTMGFLFLAGALGVWAIRSTAQVESRRRVGRFVDAMEYLSDGLLAVDRRGRITGSNPAARRFAGIEPGPKSGLRDLFGALTAEQELLLLSSREPQEVECLVREAEGLRALRFRSQPSEDIQLILVSDVTQRKTEEIRARQVATLQLIGRIARGVAHDFNNILCAISGHAELAGRSAPGPDQAASLQAISHESRRGASLAAHVLRLSQAEAQGHPCSRLAEQLQRTVELLKVGLSSRWRLAVDIQDGLGPTLLTGSQIEQIILSLSLLAADELGHPGHLQVRARTPNPEDSLFDVGNRCAAAVWIAASEVEGASSASMKATPLEAGVVVSVVRSILGESGGKLDILAQEGRHGYRLCIPGLPVAEKNLALGILTEEQALQAASWRVLLAGPRTAARDDWARLLRDLNTDVRLAEDIVATLHAVEGPGEISVLVLDRKLLGEEASALARAIRKLRPRTGLVLLADADSAWDPALGMEIIREPAPPGETLLKAMLQSTEKLNPAPGI
ncbi:MAG: hypothetical protein KA248_01835 [Kiritimatiellae bacterium]|nr:hypothetical protein [Kiritimatiellia bacterium]